MSMSKLSVLTITPNPAVDKSASVDGIQPEKKLHCTLPLFQAGGGGINVARVLNRLGAKVTAAFPCGGYTGELLKDLLTAEKVQTMPIASENWVRENLAVTDSYTNRQYRFGMPGGKLRSAEWKNLLNVITKLEPSPNIIVGSGSLPPGVPIDFYAQLAKISKLKEIKFILDTNDQALQSALEEGVFMIKPNLRELAILSGKDALEGSEPEVFARSLVLTGKAQIVVVSMGAHGALLVSDTLTLHAAPPPVHRISTIGAGDSMVAGMTHKILQQKPYSEVLQFGVACGTAATLSKGTGLCRPEIAQKIHQWMIGNQ